jgi:hypothetical protein
MEEYTYRKASTEDIPFIADVIIAAEKGASSTLGFSTLFNLSEEKVKEFIISMLEEEIDGCEFSLSSFNLVIFQGMPVVGVSSWIEAHDNPPSRILKSNLLSYTFPPENMDYFRTKAHLMQGMSVERDPETLQFEYGFTSKEYRGKKILFSLMEQLLSETKRDFPEVKKAQVQCFSNNQPSINLLTNLGFEITKSVRTDNPEVLGVLPFNEKLLLEKHL